MNETDRHTKRYTVTNEWDGVRLDRFIRAHHPDMSFPTVQKLLRKGRILVNGTVAEGSSRLSDGDTVTLSFTWTTAQRRKNARTAEDIPHARKLSGEAFGAIGKEIGIVYEDSEILVVNKPSGIVVQPGNRKDRGSLLDLLDDYRRTKDSAETAESDFPYTPVHRLDGTTTGALVVAKTRPSARALSRAFSAGLVEKTYLAVVQGVPPRKTGTISTRLKVTKGKRSRAEPDPTGKKVLTGYKLVKKLAGGRSLVEVRIRTGRTHQIRAHLASEGFPVLGDTAYGAKKRVAGGRVFLHAWKLEFAHPARGGRIEVTAEPPDDFTEPGAVTP